VKIIDGNEFGRELRRAEWREIQLIARVKR